MPNHRSILIVDDDVEQSRRLEQLLVAHGYSVLGRATTVAEALGYAGHPDLHLVISNVVLHGREDGIYLVDEMRNHHYPTLLLSDTSDSFLFKKIMAVHPHAFLVRPFDTFSLLAAIELPTIDPERTELAAQFTSTIFVKSNNLLIQVKPADILYVFAEGNHCTMVTRSRRILLKMSMHQVEGLLSPQDFVQIHRNYIVNLVEIESISLTNNELVINGEILPISKTKFRDGLLRRVRV
jgi:DNA-binding LytR/AlgR family response regulator